MSERVKRLKEKIESEKKTIFNKIISYKKDFLSNFNLKLLKKTTNEPFENHDQMKTYMSFIKSSQPKQVNISCLVKEVNSHEIPGKFFDQKQSQNCFMVFQRACGNILETYFPILMDDDFLSLQSEEQIDQKLLYLNTVVEKTALNLIKKLAKPDYFSTQSKKDLFHDEQDMDKEESPIQINCSNTSKNKKIKKGKTPTDSKDRKKGKNTKIPTEATYVMQKWLLQNFQDPYPTLQQKNKMANESGLTAYQVNNWFINARERVIKKYLKKDNISNPLNNKSRKNSSQDDDYGNSRRQKKNSKRQNNSRSQFSESSLRGSKSSSEKEEMQEQS